VITASQLVAISLFVQSQVTPRTPCLHVDAFAQRQLRQTRNSACTISLKESSDSTPQTSFSSDSPDSKSGLLPLDPSNLEIIARCDSFGLDGCDTDQCFEPSSTLYTQTKFPFVNMIRLAVSVANRQVGFVRACKLRWHLIPFTLSL